MTGFIFCLRPGSEPEPRSGRFGGASTRARIYSEHGGAEKDEVRYPVLRVSDAGIFLINLFSTRIISPMLKHTGLISLLIFALGLLFVVRQWPGGLHMTFSQHVARYRVATIYYSLLFVFSLPLLCLFLISWFVPAFHLSGWFTVLAIVSSLFQILCTFIPETGGWKTTVHRILTGISGVLLLPLIVMITLSPYISLSGRWIAALCGTGMVALLFIALRNQKGHRYSLLLQVGYYALFFTAVLYATYI